MAFRQSQQMCAHCNRPTLHTKEVFHGGWGCLFTILTMGLFIPIWLGLDLLYMFTKPRTCQVCGSAN